jgi:hypothetical protein
MPKRLPNPRLPKTHRSYTVEEVASLLAVHRNTVREWIRRGLPVCDRKRPVLILGRELRDFLAKRRQSSKRPCMPGEIYCVRCRVPREPAGGLAEYRALTSTQGNLIGICPRCDCLMYRRVNRTRLDEVRGSLDVTRAQVASHIVD